MSVGLAVLGACWVVGHGLQMPIDQPATGSLVDVVDTTPLTAPAERATGRSGGKGAAPVSVQPDPTWVSRVSSRTGIPVVALRAYGRASILAVADLPGCHVGWTTLAAVGRVESVHGTLGGGRLLKNGRTSRPIVGPALDGEGGVAPLRPDATGIRLHGDPTWDHAVGPMQFIPSTWRLVGRDGNGDGTADPFNIDDAALSAATYLCGHGRDLTTPQGWTDAIYSYNQSDAYIRQVRNQAIAYAGQA